MARALLLLAAALLAPAAAQYACAAGYSNPSRGSTISSCVRRAARMHRAYARFAAACAPRLRLIHCRALAAALTPVSLPRARRAYASFTAARAPR